MTISTRSERENGPAKSQTALSARKQGRIERMKRAQTTLVDAGPRPTTYNENNGLYLADLERRWVTSKPLTRSMIEEANLPWAGRRAKVIYSWRSIFTVEGMPGSAALDATPASNPGLYEDLLSTQMAADKLFCMLGQYRTGASVRKLIRDSTIPASAYIKIGRRKMYRLRPLAFEEVCNTLLRGRLV